MIFFSNSIVKFFFHFYKAEYKHKVLEKHKNSTLRKKNNQEKSPSDFSMRNLLDE